MKRTRNILYSALSSLLLISPGCSLDRTRHTVESWHKLRATGEVALIKKDYDTAEKSFVEALNKAETLPNQPVRVAVSLEDLSKLYLATENAQKSFLICNRALALANERAKAPAKQIDVLDSSLGQCLNNSAQVLSKEKKYAQAAIAYRQARALFIDLYKHTPQIGGANQIVGSYLAVTIDGLGKSYKELGQLKEARQAYWSVKENNLVASLPGAVREKLIEDYGQIPGTDIKDKEKFANLLGSTTPQI